MVAVVIGVCHNVANINPLCVTVDYCHKAITIATHIKNGETINIIGTAKGKPQLSKIGSRRPPRLAIPFLKKGF